ncbi:MAG: hypothetical protein PHS44_00490 [Candidatus Dojkabacteria bacterium]|nr:hypothetical protein [Candidatus Dojkabacteria bacterium]
MEEAKIQNKIALSVFYIATYVGVIALFEQILPKGRIIIIYKLLMYVFGFYPNCFLCDLYCTPIIEIQKERKVRFKDN